MDTAQRKLEFANLMEKACRAYQVKRLDPATFELYHNALAKYSIRALEAQLDRHIATAQFFPKVADLKPPDHVGGDDRDREDRIYAYGEPQTTKNPQGNPHHVYVPEAKRRRQLGETIDAYERRMGLEVTYRMYPERWVDGELLRPDYSDPAKLHAFREKMGTRGTSNVG